MSNIAHHFFSVVLQDNESIYHVLSIKVLNTVIMYYD